MERRLFLFKDRGSYFERKTKTKTIFAILFTILGFLIGVGTTIGYNYINSKISTTTGSFLNKSRSVRELKANPPEESPLLLCRKRLADARAAIESCRNESSLVNPETENTTESVTKSAEGQTISPQKRDESEKLKLELENKTKMFSECEVKRGALFEERNNLSALLSTAERYRVACNPGWTYFNVTDSCYYLHDFTGADRRQFLNTFLWETAEKNCQRWPNGHLVSLHSKAEERFVKDLIRTNIKDLNPAATEKNACHGSEMYAWIGIRSGGEGRRWSDGTKNTYLLDGEDCHGFMMCSDDARPNAEATIYCTFNRYQVQARYVCKAPADPVERL